MVSQLLRDLCVARKTLIILTMPLVALPILFIDGSQEMSCLYVVVIIASFWITEALPLPVTSMLPVVLFPLLGVMPAKKIISNYVKDASIFSFSCLSFAIVVEKWNLHRRVALKTLLIVGSGSKWLLLGFMLPTWFLSMWVTNTSSTAMMIPVVSAVLQQLRRLEVDKDGRQGASQKQKLTEDGTDEAFESSKRELEASVYPNEKFKHLCKALSLCICYAASIGGTGSITGTSPNLIMQGQADEVFNAYGLQSGVNFLNWIVCGFPSSCLCLIIAWLWLVVYFLGPRELFNWNCGDRKETAATHTVLRAHVKKLGPLSFAEKSVIVHFFVLVTLWFTMKLPGGYGWSHIFKEGYIGNSTPGIVILVSLFVFPSERPQSRKQRDSSKIDTNRLTRSPTLLDWPSLHNGYPWGTFLLITGGYAMAAACQSSGLSKLLGTKLGLLGSMEPWILLLVITVSVSFLTEITSNSVTMTVLSPILAQVAMNLQLNPLYLLLPAALTSSVAFMLPVATPPNAIAFATGHLEVKDMAKAGFILNLLCVPVVNLGANTWMNAYMDLKTLPPAMNAALPTVEPINSTGTQF